MNRIECVISTICMLILVPRMVKFHQNEYVFQYQYSCSYVLCKKIYSNILIQTYTSFLILASEGVMAYRNETFLFLELMLILIHVLNFECIISTNARTHTNLI